MVARAEKTVLVVNPLPRDVRKVLVHLPPAVARKCALVAMDAINMGASVQQVVWYLVEKHLR